MFRRRWALRTALIVAAIGAEFCQQALATVQPGILWQTDLEVAKRIASQSNRMVLVHFWSPSCTACKTLDKDVFSQPQVQQTIQAHFIPVKLNADDWPTTVKAYGVTRLPSDLVLTPSGQIVGRMTSPLKPDAYLQQLAIASNGAGPAATPAGAAYAANLTNTAPLSPAIAPPGMNAQAPATTPAMPATAPATGGMAWGAAPPPQQPIAAPGAAAPPAMSNYSDSRYAEFQQRFGAPAAAVPPQGAFAAQSAFPSAGFAAPQTPAAMSPQAAIPANPQTPYAAAQPTMPAAQAPQPQVAMPANSPFAGYAAPAVAPAVAPSPVGMEGYCPVTLVEQHRWQVGDARYGAIHRGRTYLFAGPEEQRKFLANPDRYSPAISGRDVVAALDYGQEVDGKRALGLEYGNRIYLFSSEATRQMFTQNRDRYAAEVLQAETAGQPTRR